MRLTKQTTKQLKQDKVKQIQVQNKTKQRNLSFCYSTWYISQFERRFTSNFTENVQMSISVTEIKTYLFEIEINE